MSPPPPPPTSPPPTSKSYEDSSIPPLTQLEDYLENALRKKQAEAKDVEVKAQAKVEEIQNLINYLTHYHNARDKTIGLRHMVDLGSEIFLETCIDDMSIVMVELAYGFYANMVLSDAIEFLRGKLELAQTRHDSTVRQLALAKTEVKCFLEALESRLFNL